MSALGLKNCVWRTPGSDVGRDIEGEHYFSDIAGFVQCQKWYVECKRYTSSVAWPIVWEKISYAEAHDADILLFAISSSLSPQAIDQVNLWNEKKKRPLINVLSGTDIVNRLREHPHLLVRYGLSAHPECDVAISMLPTIRFLLSLSYSISSSIEVESDPSSKMELMQAVTDLVSARLEDLDANRDIAFCSFSIRTDGYPWLDGGDVLEQSMLDKFSIRVMVCYLRFCTRETTVTASRANDGRICLSGSIRNGSMRDRLVLLAAWFDFNVFFEDDRIVLEGK